MPFVVENLRLKELVAVANQNKPFFDDFVQQLGKLGYGSIHQFVMDPDEAKAVKTLIAYLGSPAVTNLYDGIARPYEANKAKWLFLGWVFRDAPEQRLRPIVASQPGANITAKRAYLFNELRKSVSEFFPEPESWGWSVIREIMIDRLEGSRRSIKGTLFEAIVRRNLTELFAIYKLPLQVTDREVKIGGETYDVEVRGPKASVLLPVKTRETMGGGHAMLFTRDIHKSIHIAQENGYVCIPIVIAESWGGDLEGLDCLNRIYIQHNPNQIALVEPLLRKELESLIAVFQTL